LIQLGPEFFPKVLICAVRPEGAFHQWREDPPRELSIALVADERFGWVTGWIEASGKGRLWAVEQSDGRNVSEA
jgi:hypothetical protein